MFFTPFLAAGVFSSGAPPIDPALTVTPVIRQAAAKGEPLTIRTAYAEAKIRLSQATG